MNAGRSVPVFFALSLVASIGAITSKASGPLGDSRYIVLSRSETGLGRNAVQIATGAISGDAEPGNAAYERAIGAIQADLRANCEEYGGTLLNTLCVTDYVSNSVFTGDGTVSSGTEHEASVKAKAYCRIDPAKLTFAQKVFLSVGNEADFSACSRLQAMR